MNRPLIFRFPFSYEFKKRLFFRFYNPVKKKWHGIFENAPIKAAPGIVLKLLSSDFMHGLIAFTGIYEEELTSRLSEQAGKGGVLVDVGANAGYFSTIWAALNPSNKVLSFEASPRNVGILNENIKKNGLQDRVKVYGFALGKEKGVLPFDCGPEDLTGWGGLVLESKAASIEVDVERLDQLLTDVEIIDVLKIDVEGADTWVLMGADLLLRNKQIKLIYFEQNKTRLNQLAIREDEAVEYLASVGYKAVPLSDTSEDIVDWMATPEECTN